MLCIYDVVFEKVNFRKAFDTVQKKIHTDSVLTDKRLLANEERIFSSIAVRAAVVFSQYLKKHDNQIISSLLKDFTFLDEEVQISINYALDSQKNDKIIIALFQLLYYGLPISESYLFNLYYQKYDTFLC